MADWPPLKNSAFTVTFPIYDADGDLVTGATSPDSEVSIDAGTFTDVSPGEATEIASSSGIYYLALTASEMNGDIIATITKSGTGKTAVNVMYTVTRQLVDLAYPATSGRSIQVETDGMVHGDLKEWLGVAPNALQSSRVDAYVGAMATGVIVAGSFTAGAIDAAAIANGAIDAATFAAGAIDAAAIANGAIDAATFAAGAIDAAAVATDAIDADAIATDAVDEIVDQVWNELRSGHVGVGSFGEGVASVQGNVTGSVASVTGDVGGNVTGSIGSVATGGITAGSFTAGAIDAAAIANGAIDAATFAAGAIDAAAIANGAIDAATFASGAIDAAALAADAANEIADALLVRDVDQVEGSAPVHSMTTAILKAVSRIRDNAGTLEVYRTNGTTIHMSQTVTVDSGLDPVDELTVGA